MDVKDKLRILELVDWANVSGFREGQLSACDMDSEAESQRENYLENRREVKKILGLSE